MKKVLLTAVIAFSTLIASAQFMVITNYDHNMKKGASMNKFTADLGIGYMVNDAFTVGIANGTATPNGYDLWVRYNIAQVEGAYASLKIPTAGSENMKIGLGVAFNVSDNLYIEPNYSMATSNRDGSFNFGLSYRFNDIKLPTTSFEPNLINKVISWINTPLPNGYRAYVLN